MLTLVFKEEVIVTFSTNNDKDTLYSIIIVPFIVRHCIIVLVYLSMYQNIYHFRIIR
jgi:hypothetical protein